MLPVAVLSLLRSGTSFEDAATRFMTTHEQAPSEDFVSDLLDLVEALEDEEGLWSKDQPGTLSTWHIQDALLSALSKSWKVARPSVGKGWAHEMRAVVLVLNGKFRTTTFADLEQNINRPLALVLRARRPEPKSTFKGKRSKASKVVLIDSSSDEDEKQVQEA